MKIAFASTDGVHINEHFGWAKSYYLYEVDEASAILLKTIDSSKEIEDEKEKLSYKIETISEADMMYCSQIGPTASKMVHSAKIHPIRSAETINEAISKLQTMLSSNPPLWLLRIHNTAKQRSL